MTQTDSNDPDTQTREPSRGSRWRPVKILAVVVVVALALIWFGFWLYHHLTHVSGKDAQVATHEVTVSSRLPGRVTKFDLIEGDRLQTGETIAQLYSKPARLKLDALKARVASEKAQIRVQKSSIALAKQQMSGSITETRSMLAADEARVEAAKAQMQRARDKANRAQKLYKAHGATRQKRNTTRFTYQARRSQYEQAQHKVRMDHVALANAHTGLLANPQMKLPNPMVQTQKLKVMQSKLAQARARLDHQKNKIEDLRITSPLKGVVDKTFVQAAEYVSAGQPILMMHDPGNVWVEAKIKETKIHSLKTGQPVQIHVDARPDTHYKGHIRVIGHAATNQFALLPNPNPSGNFTKITQRIPVRIAIDKGPRKELSPGMMVEVDIDITGNGNKHPSAPNDRHEQETPQPQPQPQPQPKSHPQARVSKAEAKDIPRPVASTPTGDKKTGLPADSLAISPPAPYTNAPP